MGAILITASKTKLFPQYQVSDLPFIQKKKKEFLIHHFHPTTTATILYMNPNRPQIHTKAKKNWTQTTTSFPASANQAPNEHPDPTSHSCQLDLPQLARRLLICAWTVSESLLTIALASKDFWFLMLLVKALILGLASFSQLRLSAFVYCLWEEIKARFHILSIL